MSTLVAQTISNGTVSTSSANVIRGSARAWVNFNGNSGAVIRDSFNVSSMTYGGTGIYTINFTTVMPNVNYSVVGSAMFSGASDGQTAIIGPRRGVTAYNTGNIIVQTSVASSASLNDVLYGNIAVFSS